MSLEHAATTSFRTKQAGSLQSTNNNDLYSIIFNENMTAKIACTFCNKVLFCETSANDPQRRLISDYGDATADTPEQALSIKSNLAKMCYVLTAYVYTKLKSLSISKVPIRR